MLRTRPCLSRPGRLAQILILLTVVSGTWEAAAAQDDDTADEFVFRQPDDERLLQQASADLAAGNIDRGLERIQFLLDHDTDSFVIRSDEPNSISTLHDRAVALLQQQSEPIRQRYEELYGPAAAGMLTQAIHGGRLPDLYQVRRRFPATTAGLRAATRIALRQLDRGNPASALRVLHTGEGRPGWSPLARQLLSVARERVRSQAQQADLPPTSSLHQNLMAGHQPTRRTQYSGLAKDLLPWPEPHWSLSLLGAEPSRAANLVRDWRDAAAITPADRCATHAPVVTGSHIVARGIDGLVCADLTTGRVQWRYKSAASIDRESELQQEQSRSGRLTWEGYRGNSTMNQLATDGHLVFAIDFANVRVHPRSNDRFNVRSFRRGSPGVATNRLVALPVSHERPGIRPQWVLGGADDAELFAESDLDDSGWLSAEEFVFVSDLLGVAFDSCDTNKDGRVLPAEFAGAAELRPDRLAGCFFMGPPLVLDDQLLLVAERRQHVVVVSVAPKDGRVLWKRVIGVAAIEVRDDPMRAMIACNPAADDGVVVCPTGHGVWVALDAHDGSFLWARRPEVQTEPATSADTAGDRVVTNLPIIYRSQVICRPQGTDTIVTFDLSTGTPVWETTVDAGHAGDGFLAAVNQHGVLVIGSRATVVLNREDGSVARRSAGCACSGRGYLAGDQYVVSRLDGSVAAFNMRTGAWRVRAPPAAQLRELAGRDYAFLEPQPPPGNLFPTAAGIVSCDGIRLTLLPTVAQVSEASPASPQERFRGAVARLFVGETQSAGEQLMQLLDDAPADSQVCAAVADLLHRQTAGRLPEPLQRQLRARLKSVRTSPRAQAEHLMNAAEDALASRNFLAAAHAIVTLFELDDAELHPAADEPGFQRTSDTVITGMLQRMPPDQQLAVAADLLECNGGVADRMRVLQLLPPSALRARLLNQMATGAEESGRMQIAEILWRQAVSQPAETNEDLQVRAASVTGLAGFLRRQQLPEEARHLLRQHNQLVLRMRARDSVAEAPGGLSVPDPLMVHDVVEPATATELKWPANPGWTHIAVDSRIHVSPAWDEHVRLLSSVARGPGRGSQGSSVLGLRGIDGLLAVDHTAGLVVAQRSLATTASGVPHGFRTGHAVVLTNATELSLTSLLPQATDRVWVRQPEKWLRADTLVRADLVGTRFVGVLNGSRLLCLNATDGSIRWIRQIHTSRFSVPEPFLSPESRFFGDDQALVVLAPSKEAWDAWDPASGRPLQPPPLRGTAPGTAWGRSLITWARRSGKHVLRLQDPLQERPLLEIDVAVSETGTPLVTWLSSTKAAVVTPPDNSRPARLGILNTVDHVIEAETDIPGSPAQYRGLSATSSAGHWLVCCHRTQTNRPPRAAQAFEMSGLGVRFEAGTMLAIHKETGTLAWHRQMKPHIQIPLPDQRLPFLLVIPEPPTTGIGRARRRIVARDLQLLDTASGRLILTRHACLTETPVLVFANPRDQSIRLLGPRTETSIQCNGNARLRHFLQQP